jgi:transposase
MYIATIPNRSSPPAILLRESVREGSKVSSRTLANITHWPPEKIESLRHLLAGKRMVPADALFERIETREDGAVRAVLRAMERLGFDKLLASKPCRERDLVVAMVAARIIAPKTKLATTRWLAKTTLPSRLGLEDVTEDDLYAAMDWLLDKQPDIERKLSKRHLKDNGLLLYDLSSSYVEGKHCPLAALGHNRDGKSGKLQVNYGLATDERGCPVAVTVYKGNVSDAQTIMDPLDNMRDLTGVERIVIVGDRGMITQRAIDFFRLEGNTDWVSALRSGTIAKLVEGGAIQLGLFDERNLFEITHEDFPGERLVACRNPQLAKLRAHKRQSLLEATEAQFEHVRGLVERGKLRGEAKIARRVGRIENKHKVSKHFLIEVTDTTFTWRRDRAKIEAEAALDGIYVVRTSLAPERMSTEDAVRTYKSLSQVERAFRTLKTVDLNVRPIHHRTEDRVRAHILLCMLAYYVQWHMLAAWRELLFADEDLEAKKTRDPVAPAKRSQAALDKVAARELPNSEPVHSFRTLIEHLSALVRNICRRASAPDGEPTVELHTTPDPTQARALELLDAIAV